MGLFREKKEEYASVVLALLYLFCHGVVSLTMTSLYRFFGIRREAIKLKHAEVFLVSTTLFFVFLIVVSQYWMALGWLVVIFGNLRILQIICINLLTILFNFTPTASAESSLHRARWHFVALAFSIFDVVLIFAFMYQFFDGQIGILNQHFSNYLDYYYYSLVTISTVGYGDVHPVTLLGRCLVSYEIVTFLFMIVFFVSGISGRFERHT